MLTPQPQSGRPIIDSMFRATREFYEFLKDLVDSQPPVGSILMSISPTPPKGYIEFGSTFTKERYPKLYALIGDRLPAAPNGMYFAHVPMDGVGGTFGTNGVSINHTHQTVTVASGSGATALAAGNITPSEIDNRPLTFGVRCYIKAE